MTTSRIYARRTFFPLFGLTRRTLPIYTTCIPLVNYIVNDELCTRTHEANESRRRSAAGQPVCSAADERIPRCARERRGSIDDWHLQRH